MRAQLWRPFAGSAWAQPATVVAGMTVEGAVLASVLLVGLGLTTVWQAQEETALLWHLFAWSTFPQPAPVLAGTIPEDARLASLRLFSVGSASHYVGGHDR